MFGQGFGVQIPQEDGLSLSSKDLRPGLRAQLDLLLSSGGSHDIWPDAVSGRTPLGTYTKPAQHEIWFSSAFVSNISPCGYKAAGQALERIIPGGAVEPIALGHWFDELRSDIIDLYGIDGTEVVLASSNQDAEQIAMAAAQAVLKRPVAPVSTSTCFIGHSHGAEHIDPRNSEGQTLSAADILEETVRKVDHLLSQGRAILMHMDERISASHVPLAIAMLAPLRTLILVDATDGRCSRAMIRRHLAQGFMVMISGARFAGGPACSAALLLPPDIADRLASLPAQDMASVAIASFDLPRPLRGWVQNYNAVANLGLGLRWSAALAELMRYYAIEPDVRHQIIDYFDRKMRSRAALCHFISLTRDEPSSVQRSALSRIALLLPPETTMSQARLLREQLAQPQADLQGDALCHLGAVDILGTRLALSAALNAAQIADVAARMEKGVSFERACAPLSRDIDTLMRKWDCLDMIHASAQAA